MRNIRAHSPRINYLRRVQWLAGVGTLLVLGIGLTALAEHPPRKTGEWNIKPEYPWERGGVGPYSNVLFDGQKYRMWYAVMDTVQWDAGHTNGCICYATSSDGIHWVKPMLGLTAYNGSRSNNIVVGHGAAGLMLGQDGGMVFIDPNA